jgi:hypothetical protein
MALTDIEKKELAILKETATKAGIKFHPATGLQKMRDLVRRELAPSANSHILTEAGDISTEQSMLDAMEDKTSMEARALRARINMPMLPQFQSKLKKEQNARNECGRLVRIIAHNNNPLQKDWQGEIITAANDLGTWRKFVLFDVEYHVPKIILNVMKEKKYSHFYTKKNDQGIITRKVKMLPTYNIEILEPLTKRELAQLQKQQQVTLAEED